jgi:hypothetical protein
MQSFLIASDRLGEPAKLRFPPEPALYLSNGQDEL